MYDPKFSVKQMYDQYGSSRKTTKKVDPKPSKSSGFGGMGPDPAESFGGSPTRGLGSKPTFNFGTDDSSGSDNNPNRDAYESKSAVAKLYDRTVTLLRNFGADEPEDVIVDGKRVYKGPLFRGFDPTASIGDFGGETGKKQYLFGMPSLGEVTPRSPTPPTLPPADTNPTLNMFGVTRDFARDPDPLLPPVLPESPANMDPMTRGLSQAMLPEPVEPTADYTTQAGDTLFSIQKTLKENGINTTVEEIAEINDIGLDGIFGIKPGTELKLPMPDKKLPTEFMDAETKAMLQETTPIKANFIKDNLDKITQSDLAKLLRGEITADEVAKNLGIDVETDTDKIQGAVDNAGGIMKQQKVTTAKTKANIKNVQSILTNLNYGPKGIDGIIGGGTRSAIERFQVLNNIKAEVYGELDEATIKALNDPNAKRVTEVSVGNLTVSSGSRNDYNRGQPNPPPGSKKVVIAHDYNDFAGNPEFGVEVIVPQYIYDAGPGNPYFDAAQKYVNLVVEFAKSKGYDYSARRYSKGGVKPNNNRGATNVIHTEPFFIKDKTMVTLVQNNFEEFADISYQAFKDVDGVMVAPHNVIKRGKHDKGTASKEFGTETAFGEKINNHIMKKYGNK